MDGTVRWVAILFALATRVEDMVTIAHGYSVPGPFALRLRFRTAQASTSLATFRRRVEIEKVIDSLVINQCRLRSYECVTLHNWKSRLMRNPPVLASQWKSQSFADIARTWNPGEGLLLDLGSCVHFHQIGQLRADMSSGEIGLERVYYSNGAYQERQGYTVLVVQLIMTVSINIALLSMLRQDPKNLDSLKLRNYTA